MEITFSRGLSDNWGDTRIRGISQKQVPGHRPAARKSVKIDVVGDRAGEGDRRRQGNGGKGSLQTQGN
jgi:hypothetical protein